MKIFIFIITILSIVALFIKNEAIQLIIFTPVAGIVIYDLYIIAKQFRKEM